VDIRAKPSSPIFKKRFGIVSNTKPVSNEYFVEKIKAASLVVTSLLYALSLISL
jgi:hypothetical protein